MPTSAGHTGHRMLVVKQGACFSFCVFAFSGFVGMFFLVFFTAGGVLEIGTPPLCPAPPLVLPQGGGVTWSTQKFLLRFTVLLCGLLCCEALPLVSLVLLAGHLAHFC